MAFAQTRQVSCGQVSVSPRCEARHNPCVKFAQNGSRMGCAAKRLAVASNVVHAANLRSGPAALAACISKSVAGPSELQLSYPPAFSMDESEATHYDIVGFAQSMLDITTESAVSDQLLASLRVEKGGRRVLASAGERSSVLETLDDAGSITKITPGGSLANTLVAISRLSMASGRARLSVALQAPCSSDALGQFFSSQLCGAGVAVLPTSDTSGHTGTVFVLASPDAQRSFLSFFHSEPLTVSRQMRRVVAKSRLVVVEGYLWELPNAAAVIAEVVDVARSCGAQVALTAGDARVVAKHRKDIMQVLQAAGKDVLLFANAEEACELLGKQHPCSASAAAQELGSLCNLAVVTDGSCGSHVSYMGHLQYIPTAPAPMGVVDTCGAGDAYAAGFCYALMMAHDCAAAGRFASNVAARVIGRHGAQLLEEEAEELVRLLPAPALQLPYHASQATRPRALK